MRVNSSGLTYAAWRTAAVLGRQTWPSEATLRHQWERDVDPSEIASLPDPGWEPESSTPEFSSWVAGYKPAGTFMTRGGVDLTARSIKNAFASLSNLRTAPWLDLVQGAAWSLG